MTPTRALAGAGWRRRRARRVRRRNGLEAPGGRRRCSSGGIGRRRCAVAPCGRDSARCRPTCDVGEIRRVSCSRGPFASRRTAASMSPPTARRARWTRCICSNVKRCVRPMSGPNVANHSASSGPSDDASTSIQGRTGRCSIGGAERADSAQTRCDDRSSHRRVAASSESPISSTTPRPVIVASRTSADHSASFAGTSQQMKRPPTACVTAAWRRRIRSAPVTTTRPDTSPASPAGSTSTSSTPTGRSGSGESSPSSVHTTPSSSETRRSAQAPSCPTSTNPVRRSRAVWATVSAPGCPAGSTSASVPSVNRPERMSPWTAATSCRQFASISAVASTASTSASCVESWALATRIANASSVAREAASALRDASMSSAAFAGVGPSVPDVGASGRAREAAATSSARPKRNHAGLGSAGDASSATCVSQAQRPVTELWSRSWRSRS